MRTLYLFRHGQSLSNVNGVYNTQDDLLTENGRQQVLDAASYVQSLRVDRVIVSPLVRAQETAELLGVSFETDKRLADWEFGEFAGRPFGSFGQFTREQGLDKRTFTPPGGESLATFHERIVDFVNSLPKDGSFLVVSHAGVIKNLVHIETGRMWEGLHPENAALWVVQGGHLDQQNWKPWQRKI